MKRNHFPITALVLALCSLALAVPLMAASMGTSGGYDLDALWTRAQRQYDLAAQDAIVLLEERHVTIAAGGVMRTSVHRVVWIGSSRGIHDYADLRIPWNSATSTMTVTALRTWRDDRWWPDATEVSPTAVVETLPYAVALADDYSAMRETMLLHDGVGLPCIMETAYTIEEKTVDRGGFDGVFVFAQEDPAVMSVLSLTLPESSHLTNQALHGAPAPAVAKNDDGTSTCTWTMELVEPLGVPHIESPLSYAPYVVWSTWNGLQELSDEFMAAFDGAAIVSSALADTLAARLKYELGTAAQARKVAALINEWTRAIGYSSRFWIFAPRPAERTFETGYGHDLDRAVLAAGLFRGAGFEVEPILFSGAAAGPATEIPFLSLLDAIGVRIHSGTFNAFYDPHAGNLIEGPLTPIIQYWWLPSYPGKSPQQLSNKTSGYELSLAIEPENDGNWRGSGYVKADGVLSPYGEMVGIHDGMLERIGAIVKSIAPGGTVRTCNPDRFTRNEVAVGFDFGIEKIEPDKQGRTVITIDDPAGGIHSRLPDDIHLYQEHRTSPVVLPHTLSQTVSLRLKRGDRAVISLPGAIEIANDTGSLSVKVSDEDGWITVERTLTLRAGLWDPDRWMELRNVLLGEEDAAGRIIVLE